MVLAIKEENKDLVVEDEILNNSIIYYTISQQINLFKSNKRMPWVKKRKKDVAGCEKS